MTTPLQQAAQAVIDHCYEYNPHELPALHLELRKALDAELHQTAKPVAWAIRRADGLVLDVICPDEHESHEGDYTIPLYLHPPQQATVKQYLKVGDSRFESWYSELNQASKGSKQIAREAYEAGLNEAHHGIGGEA